MKIIAVLAFGLLASISHADAIDDLDMQRLVKTLKLDANQSKKIEAIYAQQAAQIASIHRQINRDLAAVLDQQQLDDLMGFNQVDTNTPDVPLLNQKHRRVRTAKKGLH